MYISFTQPVIDCVVCKTKDDQELVDCGTLREVKNVSCKYTVTGVDVEIQTTASTKDTVCTCCRSYTRLLYNNCFFYRKCGINFEITVGMIILEEALPLPQNLRIIGSRSDVSDVFEAAQIQKF